MHTDIPRPIIGLVSEIISEHYTHAQLDNLFLQADAPGDPPLGNKLVKCQTWLARCNKEVPDSLRILGAVIEDFMERILRCSNPLGSSDSWIEEWQASRNKIYEALASHGLNYSAGGLIHKLGSIGATKSLEHIIKSKDIAAVEVEFDRALVNIDRDPPASLTAACAIIESICRVIIEEKNLPLPKDLSIKQLWNVLAKYFGFDPSSLEDNDLRKILTGLSSIVDGVGSLRTHAGSAHGRGMMRYNIQPRHARLAVNAAHTLAIFIFESWDNKNTKI